jgi:hypothetical protein
VQRCERPPRARRRDDAVHPLTVAMASKRGKCDARHHARTADRLTNTSSANNLARLITANEIEVCDLLCLKLLDTALTLRSTVFFGFSISLVMSPGLSPSKAVLRNAAALAPCGEMPMEPSVLYRTQAANPPVDGANKPTRTCNLILSQNLHRFDRPPHSRPLSATPCPRPN